MNQIVNRTIAFLFIWVVGLGFVTCILFQIDKTDFSHLDPLHNTRGDFLVDKEI